MHVSRWLVKLFACVRFNAGSLNYAIYLGQHTKDWFLENHSGAYILLLCCTGSTFQGQQVSAGRASSVQPEDPAPPPSWRCATHPPLTGTGLHARQDSCLRAWLYARNQHAMPGSTPDNTTSCACLHTRLLHGWLLAWMYTRTSIPSYDFSYS